MSNPNRTYAKRTYVPRKSYARPAYSRPAYSRPTYRRTQKAVREASRKPKFYPMVGGAIGGAIAGPAGIPVGAAVGRGVGNFITGFGDYQVSKNVFLTGAPPIVKNVRRDGSGGVTISFREFIGNVVSSSSANTFDLTAYPIVPTSLASFPWLSQLAGNFQEWNPEGIVYEYRSTSADALNSTNTALGTVLMATNYNSALPAYGSESEMLNSEFSASVKPSDNCMHMIECKRSASVLGNLYTKTTGDEDVRFSQLGNFQLATDGFQGTSVQCGQLWITYQIALNKPKLSDALGEDVGVVHIIGSGCTDALPLGTSFALQNTSNLDVISPTGLILHFPVSQIDKSYIYTVFWLGDSTSAISTPGSSTNNAAPQFMWLSGNNAAGQIGITGTKLFKSQIVKVPSGSQGQIIFDTNATLPANSQLDIKIIEVPNSFIVADGTSDFLPG